MKKILTGIAAIGISMLFVGAASAAVTSSLFGNASIVPSGGNPGQYVQATSDLSTTTPYGGIDFSMPAGTTFNDLTTLSTDFEVLQGGCGSGAPRFSVELSSGKNVFVYFGPYPDFTGCGSGWQSTGNVVGTTTLRVDTSQVGGTFYDNWADAQSLVGSQNVTDVALVVDGGGAGQPQSIGFDNTNVDGTIDNYEPVPSVTTTAATGLTNSDATMNAMNGPVAADDGESFWVSTSTINTSSPTIPMGVYSTQIIPAVGAGDTFSDTLSSLTTTNGAYVYGQVPGTMPAVTPGTTYYYVAWIDVDGMWYPGNQESVTIPLPTYTVTIDKFINDSMAMAASANSDSFPMVSSWNAANLGGAGGPANYSLTTTGFNSSNAYEAITSPMNAGSMYTTNEVTGGSVVGADCSGGQPFALTGYTTGTTLADAEAATPSMTVPDFTNLQSNENVIVWNVSCTPSVTTDAATPVTAISATLNGTDGPVNASDTSFWWGTGAPTSSFTSGSNPAATQLPAGWTHDSGLTAVSANGNFDESVTSLMPGETYYFVAWVEVGGIWYPGNVQSFKTPSITNACANPTSAPAGFNLVTGTTANENITLPANTMFVGKGNGNNTIKGGSGDYIICTGSGNDTITLDTGTDVVNAGGGNNDVSVGDGNNTITSGSGNDTITVGNGSNTINAGDGNNVVKAGTGMNTITSGSGNDTITTKATGNSISAGGGNNTIKQ